MVVFPAASNPTIRIRISVLPLKSLPMIPPMMIGVVVSDKLLLPPAICTLSQDPESPLRRPESALRSFIIILLYSIHEGFQSFTVDSKPVH